ncbi:acyl-CoA dehydrogenase family protein [Rhodococcus sp. 24CO]|uniref:acyl-CoA dehydrogenase family protein n=1 Tax=Rhodococcus sp. 24CO TaxID=3117460 RepID=UPI003D34D79D
MYDPIEFPEETRDIRDLTTKICEKYQMPLEERILAGEKLTHTDFEPGIRAAREAGLWGLSLPEELGGANLSCYNLVAVQEAASKPLAPLRFWGELPPFLWNASGKQKELYADPVLSGEKAFCFAQTEPSGGSDPAGSIRTRAVRDGAEWVITGNKVFITAVDFADFVFVVAVTGTDQRQQGGISMFVVDIDNPGLKITREIDVLGGTRVHELFFDNCRVPAHALLGAEGGGFGQAQQMLSAARMTVGAAALGIAWRALEMMTGYAKQREAFGSRLADKQAVQGFIVDSWIEIHQARLAMYHAAQRTDEGHDTRVEAGMVKVLGTETAGRVLDRAIQVYGGAGVSFDNPLAHWYGLQRLARIYEGPTEVHKYQVIARKLLNS